MSDYIFTENFLLQGRIAQRLYHDYMKDMPIIDYHCHLSPKAIAENTQFENLTACWLKGDHYKWRAMRSFGIEEALITGNASDEEKFLAWAKLVPQTVRNPLFHWTHLELKNIFGITDYLTEKNAAAIYEQCNAKLQTTSFRTQAILHSFKVAYIGTTDEPWDTLAYHKKFSSATSAIKMSPSFRPDKVVQIDQKESFFKHLSLLEQTSGIGIKDIATFLEALQNRVDYFQANGCRVADHGFTQLPNRFQLTTQLEKEFTFLMINRKGHFSDPDAFMGFVLVALCKMYHKKNWVQQFHLGAIRNNNTRLNKQLGSDSGFDSIGDFCQAVKLSVFLDHLDTTHQLTKTIIYNSNPAHNEVFASMIGNFNDGSCKGKIQFGSGWWFLDQKEGMEKQINALSNMGLISTFIGMITDSRSFLSFPRHEYFRRIICNLFGDEMEKGLLPNDEVWVGGILKNIAYNNAKEYFNI